MISLVKIIPPPCKKVLIILYFVQTLHFLGMDGTFQKNTSMIYNAAQDTTKDYFTSLVALSTRWRLQSCCHNMIEVEVSTWKLGTKVSRQ